MYAAAIANVLGGPKVLGKNITTLDGLLKALSKGLPFRALEELAGILELERKEAVSVLNIPERTFARRKKEKRFTPEETDRLARVAWITARAVRAIGDREKAARWLKTPNRALGGRVPLSLVVSEVGAREVESVLGRIEHGVHS
jgi:putative toxin-antitoxin system antitoxin component (TIGR02293 family)